MQRWTLVLGTLLALQVAAAVALQLEPNALTPQVPDRPLVAAELKTADRLVLTGPAGGDAAQAAKPATLELRKQGGHWLLPSLQDAPADPQKVQDLLAKLAGLKRGLPVATTADAQDRFKVGSDHFERRLVVAAGTRTLATVYLGSPAGPRKSSARTAQDRSVYDVEISPYDLPTTASDWFDHGLLQRDAGRITGIAIAHEGQGVVTLHRRAGAASAPAASGGWTAEGLAAGEKLDPDKAQALAAQIASLRVDGLADAQPGGAAKPAVPAGPPLLKLTLENGGGPAQTWSLWQPKAGGDVTLQASGRPWPLTLKSWTADPLLKALQPQALALAPSAAPAPTAAASASRVSAASGQPHS